MFERACVRALFDKVLSGVPATSQEDQLGSQFMNGIQTSGSCN